MLKYIHADLSFYLLQDTCWFSVVGVPFSCPAFTTLKTPVDGHRLGATNFSHASWNSDSVVTRFRLKNLEKSDLDQSNEETEKPLGFPFEKVNCSKQHNIEIKKHVVATTLLVYPSTLASCSLCTNTDLYSCNADLIQVLTFRSLFPLVVVWTFSDVTAPQSLPPKDIRFPVASYTNIFPSTRSIYHLDGGGILSWNRFKKTMKSFQEDIEIVSRRQTQKAEVRKMTNTFPAHAYM